MKKYTIVAVLVALLMPVLAPAQTERGIITGTVSDSSGAVVPGASVSATNVLTNARLTTTTTSSGNYTIPSVPPGTYTVRIEVQGFKTLELTGVVVVAGGTVVADGTLEVGQVTESISVSSALAQIQTETAKVTTQVSNRMVDELPLVVGGAMRGAFDLALVAPQANVPQGVPGGEDKGFNVGGGQAGGYGATLDGVSILTGRFNSVQWANVNTPSVDAITEFSVETNG